MADRLLAIYLNDHLAGASAGVELARRTRSSNHDDAEFGAPLAAICAEVEADRATLADLMEQLGIRQNKGKQGGAWLGEKLGRLKLNGQLHGYSPLSRVVELEGLCLGITGKMQLWRALERSLDSIDGFDFEQLAERAAQQRETAEQLRLQAASRAFPPQPQ
ncbi:MAG TPA: hypothetical protein VGO36_01695 [Solirubrobacterales bacterium]|jgi:hypothetical protein|nr:hypothetical protein [Solirubrobacterales bacterium]